MNTRFLFIVSLIIAVMAAWFYRSQGDIKSAIPLSQSNIEYQATDIIAVQTDEQGVAEYSLTADDLTHYSDKNLDRLQTVTINWRPNFARKVVINADEAEIYYDTSKVVMSNNVIFASSQVKASSSNNTINNSSGTDRDTNHSTDNIDDAQMMLKASELIGNLEQRVIYSEKPIKVNQSKNEFEAESFEANMLTGDYDFKKVAVTFMPPQRANEALF